MDISVARTNSGDLAEFAVVVRDGKDESRHSVTMAQETLDRLASGQRAEAVVEAAFKFLLDREPKESILKRFDITVIGRYFPAFEKELPNYFK